MWNFLIHFKVIQIQWRSAQRNFWGSLTLLITLLINNLFFCYGTYGLSRKVQSGGLNAWSPLLFSSTIVLLAWPIVKLFFGGWLRLRAKVLSGAFETALAGPKHPLSLTALENPEFMMSLSELIQGAISWLYLMRLYGLTLGGQLMLAAFNSALGFIAILILANAAILKLGQSSGIVLMMRGLLVNFSLFLPLVSQQALSLVYYTPLLFTAILPLNYISAPTLMNWIIGFSASTGAIVVAVLLFNHLLKYYEGTNAFINSR